MSLASFEDAARELHVVRRIILAYTSARNQEISFDPLELWHGPVARAEMPSAKPPLSYDAYLDIQSEAITRISTCALISLRQWQQSVSLRFDQMSGALFDPKKVSLLLIGSAAKLEFFPGNSDLDFLAILHVDDASTAAEYFADLKRQLAQAAVSAGIVDCEDDVDVSGGPGNTFLTHRDVVLEPGGKAEPNWAASFRAQLVTEARTISCAPEYEQLVEKTQEHYSALLDLASGLYPLISTRLLLNVSIGGVLGQAIALRKEAGKKNDQRVLKAVVSREWSSAINLLTIHIFYWQVVAQLGDAKDVANALTEALARTPLHQLCSDCAEGMKHLTQSDALDRLRQRLSGMRIRSGLIRKVVGSVRAPTQDFVEALDDNIGELENGGWTKVKEYQGGWLQDVRNFLLPDAKPEPLWVSYLDAMDLYGKVRSGASLVADDVEKLAWWSGRFGKALEVANKITRVIMDHDMRSQLKAGSDDLAGYKKLIRCHAVSRLLS
jgi:hypothetical protein